MKLDWQRIWERYEQYAADWDGEEVGDDPFWVAVGEQANVAEEYKLQIDEVHNQMLAWYAGEEPVDGVDYDLSDEEKLSMQDAIMGAVELALRLQDRGFEQV